MQTTLLLYLHTDIVEHGYFQCIYLHTYVCNAGILYSVCICKNVYIYDHIQCSRVQFLASADKCLLGKLGLCIPTSIRYSTCMCTSSLFATELCIREQFD